MDSANLLSIITNENFLQIINEKIRENTQNIILYPILDNKDDQIFYTLYAKKKIKRQEK